MILSVSNIHKSFNDETILKDISFTLEDHDKAAIVGPNGCGKTTLIRIIVKELEADSGEIALSKDKELGYLAQDVSASFTGNIMDVLLSTRQDILDMETRLNDMAHMTDTLSGDELTEHIDKQERLRERFERADGYSYRSRVGGVFKGLGFTPEDSNRDVASLSGGEKMRLKLGCSLLKQPDLLILDEPTNHLDMHSLIWLEGYLSNYPGAVLIVSHDRFFLDKIANKIIEIDHTKSTVFSGNYTDYAAKKEILRIQQMNAYINQQRTIKHQQEVIEKLQSFNREKSIRRAESRKKMLSKIEVLDKPEEYNDQMKIILEPNIESGKDVLTIDNLTKSYDGRTLFANQNIEIKRGEHVAIIGDNGTGKTTLLKIINGLEDADKGQITLGTKVHIGYYDQEHHVLNDSKTLFEEISDAYPDMTETEIRSTLAAFLFTGDDVFKLIGDLSGGEKGRMSLAKLMLSEANFLILDEPTNHLDIASREILEGAINHYTGTVLYVSHDRYFIDQTSSRIIELAGGTFTSYVGDYTYYLEKSNELKANNIAPSSAAVSDKLTVFANTTQDSIKNDSSANDYKLQKAKQAEQRKKENAIKKCEEKIASIEAENDKLNEQLNDPSIATNSVKLQEVASKIANNDEILAELYNEWEMLCE